MSHMPIITVIIPVYNVENYLPQCIDSVIGQTYTNLEIILVDDGSTDTCPQICDEYATKDSRINVIHKANGGLSDARNAGLDIAAGEYITFADSDDWLEPDMIEFLFSNLTAHKADIACCGYYSSYVNINEAGGSICNPCVITGEQAAVRALTRQFNHESWGKLYNKHIFDTVRYPVGKKYEDAWIIVDVLMAATTVSIDPMPKYHYRRRKSGIIGDSSVIAKSLLRLEMLEARQVSINNNFPQLADLNEAELYRKYIRAISTILSTYGYAKSPEGREVMSAILTKIKRSPKRLFQNPSISNETRSKLRLLKTSIHLYKFVTYGHKGAKSLHKAIYSLIYTNKKVKQICAADTTIEKILFE